MKKIDILGWYNRANIGDDAFQQVLGGWFADHDVQFITPPQETRKDADLVILGGGAVVSEYYLERIHHTRTDGRAIPVIALGVDVEYPQEIDLLVNSGIDKVFFRSLEDVALFNSTVEDMPMVEQARFTPDLVFDLTVRGKPILPSYKKTDKRTVAVFATDYVMPSSNRDLYFFGPRADQFAQGLAGVLDKMTEKCEIILMPCSTGQTGNDRRVNLHIASFMRKPPVIVEEQFEPSTMIDFIADCTATMCMRYHAHIFSLIAGTPFVSIEYTKKARTIMGEYQPRVSRPLLGVSRIAEGEKVGFFNFDETYDALNEAVRVGTSREEEATSKAFATECRKGTNSIRELILKDWL